MIVWPRIPLVLVLLLSGLRTCVCQWGIIAPPNDCSVVGNGSNNVMYVWDTTFNSTACDYATQFSKSLFPQCFMPSWKGSPEVRTRLINAATVGDGCNRISRIFVSNVYTPARQSTLSQSAPCNADVVDLVSRGKAAGLLVYALLAANDLPFTEQYQAQTIVDWNAKCPTARFSGIAVNNEKLADVKCTYETAERIILDGLLNTANIVHNDSMLLHFSLGFHWSSCGSDWNNLTWRGVHKPLTQHIWDVIDSGDIQVATARVTNMVSRLIRADGGQYAGSLNKTSYALAYTNFNPGAGDCTVSFFPLAAGLNCSDGINKTEVSMWTQLNAAGANLRSTTGNQRIGGGVHYYSGIYSAGVPGWPYRGGPANITLVLQTPTPTATPSLSSSPTPSRSATSSTTTSATRSRTQTPSASGTVGGTGSTTATRTSSISAAASNPSPEKPGPLDSSTRPASTSPTSASTQSVTSTAAGSRSPTSSRSPSSAASVQTTSSASQSVSASASTSGKSSPTFTGSGSPTRGGSGGASASATSAATVSGVVPASVAASETGSHAPTTSQQPPSFSASSSARSTASGYGAPLASPTRTRTLTRTPSASKSQISTGIRTSSTTPSSSSSLSRNASSTRVTSRTASGTRTSAPSYAAPAGMIGPGSPSCTATVKMPAGIALAGGNGVSGMSENNGGGLAQFSSLASGQPGGSSSGGSSTMEIGLSIGVASIILAAASIGAALAWKYVRRKRPGVALSKTTTASRGSTTGPPLAQAVAPDTKMSVTTNPFAAHAPKAQFLPRTV